MAFEVEPDGGLAFYLWPIQLDRVLDTARTAVFAHVIGKLSETNVSVYEGEAYG